MDPNSKARESGGYGKGEKKRGKKGTGGTVPLSQIP